MKTNRRQQILEVLASELESKPGTRITTAGLATALGVSEAALYRHFASKAKMFEALIEFAEDSIFGLFNQVMDEQKDARTRCLHLTTAMLKFAERNPGIARVLVGDVLIGEHERLRQRVSQFFARVEIQFKQALREAVLDDGKMRGTDTVAAIANVLLAVVAGRLDQFVRSDFGTLPTTNWEAQWQILCDGLFPH